MRAALGVMEELGGNGWVGETGPGTIFTHPQSLGLKLSRGTAFLPYGDNSRGSRQVFRCLQKAPGQGDQGPHFPSHHVCHTKLQDQEHVTEVLHGAQFKFPGCQKIHVSKKRGFSKFNADEFEALAAEKWLILDGFGVKYIPNDGAVDTW
ncbi:hypothetical protein J1605_008971 [Eschrichtius robustus]|uniref:Uncharacterized protein n=1 Tax=Eschrichtius robustus TaxID=9764 RepID=A0AB34GXE3_ESCRO|nr:hypothetical protein J1605_008971 [Eschrichtius robustus]